MEQSTQNKEYSFESVWAALMETRAGIERSGAEFDRRMIEADKRYERRMQKIEDRYGSHSQNIGDFAEEYFFNSFENGKRNFFGEEFDRIRRKVQDLEQNVKDEYDIVMLNGTSVAIVEVKFKAHENDLPKVVKKAETFRINYPQYANHKIFLGLASMSFYPDLEVECKNQGIAIVKQVGDTMVINDENLKAF